MIDRSGPIVQYNVSDTLYSSCFLSSVFFIEEADCQSKCPIFSSHVIVFIHWKNRGTDYWRISHSMAWILILLYLILNNESITHNVLYVNHFTRTIAIACLCNKEHYFALSLFLIYLHVVAHSVMYSMLGAFDLFLSFWITSIILSITNFESCI